MDVSSYFPVWNRLTEEQQAKLSHAAQPRRVKKGAVLHNGTMDCLGLLLLRTGQLRAYILSEDGREITLYRLFAGDICLVSASCMMPKIQLEIIVEAEKDADIWLIPPGVYKGLMEESAPVANYTNEIMSSRFSDVIWLMEQVMWKSFDTRLAAFLLAESAIDGTPVLKLTHEKIAGHLGSAREVVTRMLHYFQSEGMVRLTRGTIEITDPEKLKKASLV